MSAIAASPALRLGERQLGDVEMLRVGGYAPLTGFMTRADYTQVVDEMRLANGAPWSMPITLAVDDETADTVAEGDAVALLDQSDRVVGHLEVQEKFGYDKRREAQEVYRTMDEAHPGVAALYAQGDTLLGGPVRHAADGPSGPFPDYRLTPAELKTEFAARGWRTVVGFQTRNPVHRAHEYIQKAALETVDGLLLHPLVGETKGDDVPADVRMRCYHVLLEKYYPRDRTILAVLPAAMRYAGPREAIFHALMRRNYGCTHFIVGRDHAGRRQLLRQLRCTAHLRGVRPQRAWHHAAVLRARILVPRVQRHGHHQDMSSRAVQAHIPQRHRRAGPAAGESGAAGGVHPSRGGA